MTKTISPFATESELCAAFIADATARGEWTAYPETAGFDIVLVRRSDGAQIGIEAKLALNAKVVAQALPKDWRRGYGVTGPDFRAVLVPAAKIVDGMSRICSAVGLTVIAYRGAPPKHVFHAPFSPPLPCFPERYSLSEGWHEWSPADRCKLPDYVPDVAAGSSAPTALTEWKVKAIKLAILLEDRPVTRADFKALALSPSRWTDPHTAWLVNSPAGWRAGPGLPAFKAQHPRNYEEIRADKATWAPAALGQHLFSGVGPDLFHKPLPQPEPEP